MTKTLLALVILATTSTTVNAESWLEIAKSDDGKIAIETDIDSVDIGWYPSNDPRDGMFIVGVSRYLNNGKEVTKVASAVDVQECLAKTTGAIKTEWLDGKTTMERWKKEGDTAIDHRARFLCNFVNDMATAPKRPVAPRKQEPKKIWM